MTGARSDAELARGIAAEAGALLRGVQAGGVFCKAMGDEGDRSANRLILDRLRAERPDDFILSEESEDDLARCAASRVWIVDPLDGTSEFAAGRDDWAVHVGLSIDGAPAVGAVALPARDEVFCTATSAITTRRSDAPRIVVSRSRPPIEAAMLADVLGGTVIPMGSAGAKAMAVVRGDAEAYVHSGGQYAWDSCAPAAVALSAGLHVSRLDGRPLVYNCADSWLPDLLICSPSLAPRILALLSA